MKKLRDVVASQANALDVDAALLATKRELEEIVRAPDVSEWPERFSGWRGELLRENFRQVLEKK